MNRKIKAANGIGPGAGKGARAEATERELRRYLRELPEAERWDALRELLEISAEHPPVPVWPDPPTLDQEFPDFGIPIVDAGLLPDDDEVVFPRACPAGQWFADARDEESARAIAALLLKH